MKISHSMVDAILQCEKKFEYAHVQNLEPKERSPHLWKGTVGHAILEHFFRAEQKLQKEGRPPQPKESLAVGIAHGMTMDPMVTLELVPMISYWAENKWPTLGWEILEIERTFILPLPDGSEYPYTIDLIIRRGGVLIIVDHKFQADPFDDGLLEIMPQIPKYIGAMRAMGKNIKLGIYNIFRTRSNIKEIKDRLVEQPVTPNDYRVIETFNEQIVMSNMIESKIASGEKFHRTINKIQCGHCSFQKLCRQEVSGKSTELMRQLEYKPNTYGYQDAL